MNNSIVIAVVVAAGVSAPSINAGPALIDFPGPGYRMQRDLFAPLDGKPISHLKFTPSLFFQFNFPQVESLRTDKPVELPATVPGENPFSAPIRLFESRLPWH